MSLVYVLTSQPIPKRLQAVIIVFIKQVGKYSVMQIYEPRGVAYSYDTTLGFLVKIDLHDLLLQLVAEGDCTCYSNSAFDIDRDLGVLILQTGEKKLSILDLNKEDNEEIYSITHTGSDITSFKTVLPSRLGVLGSAGVLKVYKYTREESGTVMLAQVNLNYGRIQKLKETMLFFSLVGDGALIIKSKSNVQPVNRFTYLVKLIDDECFEIVSRAKRIATSDNTENINTSEFSLREERGKKTMIHFEFGDEVGGVSFQAVDNTLNVLNECNLAQWSSGSILFFGEIDGQTCLIESNGRILRSNPQLSESKVRNSNY